MHHIFIQRKYQFLFNRESKVKFFSEILLRKTAKMASTRLMRMSKPALGLEISGNVFSNAAFSSKGSRPRTLKCLNQLGLSSENPPGGGGAERKPVAVAAAGASACLLVSEQKTDKLVDFGLLLSRVCDGIALWMKFITKKRPWAMHIEMFIEKGIIDCRFFTLLATAGSLLGSVLCFVEGCFLIVESYFQYFNALPQMSEQGHVVTLLIEAIDMFLVGTAMLTFGMALHVMFVKPENHKGPHLVSNLSNNFSLQKLPSWIGMESAVQAKSKIGHALMMILQVEVLEKFKSIPLVNGFDLACFAGTLFLSSVSIFILSRIAVAPAKATT